jgi:hypothetical protein
MPGLAMIWCRARQTVERCDGCGCNEAIQQNRDSMAAGSERCARDSRKLASA